MSTLNLERPVIERSRPGQGQGRQHAPVRERFWAHVETNVRLTVTELADASYHPRQKIHRDFSGEFARARRWFSRQTVAGFGFRRDPTPHD